MSKRKSNPTRETMTETLRRMIAESGLPTLTIANESGVARASLIRFIRNGQSLRLDIADKLADYFHLSLLFDMSLNVLRDKMKHLRNAIERAQRNHLKEFSIFANFPRDCCDKASLLAFTYLNSIGLRNCDQITVELPDMPRTKFGPAKHIWLEVNGAVVDITADQFGQSRIIVDSNSKWHQSLRNPTRNTITFANVDSWLWRDLLRIVREEM